MNTNASRWTLLWPGFLLIALIFLVEISMEALVGTMAYVLVVLYLLWFSRNNQILTVIVIVASIFISSGFLLLFTAAEPNRVIIIDRALCLVVVWLASYFTFRFNKVHAERAVKTKQLHALFENANEGILFADTAGKIMLANPRLEKMFGYEEETLNNKNISVLMADEYVNQHRSRFRSFIKSPGSREMAKNVIARHRSGKQFPVEISLSYFYNNKALTVIAFVMDATEKQKHQQLLEAYLKDIKNYNLQLEEEVQQRTNELEQSNLELKKTQYLYKAMAHHFPEGIIGVLDKNMKYLVVDGKDLEQLGLNEKTIVGDRIFDNIHSAITIFAEGNLKKVFAGESASFDAAIEGRDYNISSVPIPNANGEIDEILVVIKNVSEQRNLEKELLKNLEKEKELSLLKTRFVTLASHEFRSPLTTILSSAFLLEHYTGDQLEQERKKHLDRIKRAVHGMIELLNDFLSIGKLEEGKVQVANAEINLRTFLEDILQEVALLKKDDQRIELAYKGDEASFVTDKQMIRTILMNLLSNAIKYSPPSGVIHLSVTREKHEVTIKVSDAGIGIPLEEQRHIFKRFFRAQNAAEIQGTGLGLNIVKKYTRLLKGNVTFTSKLNEGSTFQVILPVRANRLSPTKTLIK